MTFVPAPGYLPNYNPTLPFNKTFPGGLKVGMAIYIEGVPNKDTKRFLVNFALGPEPEADIAFHINPHIDSGDKVVFNSRQSGQWGKEQVKNSLPFKEGERFELLVMVLQEHYKVTVNGNPFYEFVHRMPLQDVTHLHVHGDLTLQSINFIDYSSGSSQGAVRNKMVSGNQLFMEASAVFNPVKQPPGAVLGVVQGQAETDGGHEGAPCSHPQPVPYVVNLQGDLTPNRTFIIKGFINLSAYRFAINFSVKATGDIALHINPHIQEGVVVRNSFLNGKWGPEEKNISYNPFGPGKSFDLSICVDSYGFHVFASGQYCFDFQHRMQSFHMINLLEITGDVYLSYVQV
ncbi:galectin-4-like [Suncus etruscus]|uniref:galectin-4-like n=1 Tax=Suncus etruscus TaxID=109475 RepID=UPI00211092F9|nr:galectin-4-like [Suncus etruscus]